jgi:Pyridoxal/pyridoxine/pyridoxamine kinase
MTNRCPPKKIAAVHDLSGLGRCSLTVIIPVLSAMGFQVCPLPTAVLSSHTGGYSGFTFLDLTDEIPKIAAHWKVLDTKFDAVYTGFLGSAKQIESVIEFAQNCKKNKDTVFLADPVMGDNGTIYSTYTKEMCRLTTELVQRADIVTPNITEAAILLNTEYKENFTEKEICDILVSITDIGAEKAVLTGVVKEENGIKKIGSAYFDKKAKSFGHYFTERIDVSYPGTGDIFSSVLLGRILSGYTLEEAVRSANEFVYEAVKYTYLLQTPVREGVAVEALWDYLKR